MKIKIGVFFGGKSVEHEIAVITMSQAISSINREKYEIIPIYISKEGILYTGKDLLDLGKYKDMEKLLKGCSKVTLVNDGEAVKVIKVPAPRLGKQEINRIDVAFPIMHGTNGEDGTIQGYLNLLSLPYIGPDIVASGIGMDKIFMKKVLKESGIPVVEYDSFYSMEFVEKEKEIIARINKKLKYPLIVKPANLGSSVGISKVKTKKDLTEAIEFAMEFSDRILVETAVQNLKEINCSVIGNLTETEASVCEEPYFSDDILSYSDKYMGGTKTKGLKAGKSQGKGMAVSDKKLPADISNKKRDEIQELARKTFTTLGCSGVGRIDFLMDTKTKKVYVNEINTIPGALSYYLWEASGKSFEKEIDQLVDIALTRDREKKKLTFSYDQNILAMQGGTKGSKGAKIKK